VNLAVLGFGNGGFADFSGFGRVHLRAEHRDDLVRAEFVANGPPGDVNSGLQEPVPNGGEQMVRPARKGRCESVSIL